MKVYKVVKVIDGSFYSARTWMCRDHISSKTVLRYEIGKVTRPHFGFMFCFITITHAELFRDSYGGLILECVGVPASKKSLICFTDCRDSEKTMRECWKVAYYRISDITYIPRGTILMRTVRPIREV
jgi:hypothetical protein